MRLNGLPIPQMISLTSQWLDEQQGLFLSIPELVPLYPRLVRVHQAALNMNRTQDIAFQREELTEALKVLDESAESQVQRGD